MVFASRHFNFLQMPNFALTKVLFTKTPNKDSPKVDQIQCQRINFLKPKINLTKQVFKNNFLNE